MSHPTTPGVDSTLTPSSPDDEDQEEDEGLLLERLALLMPLVQEAVANFGRARDSDDLPQQQQVCDTLVEQATALLLAQDGDSSVAALLVHVLLDRVYTAGVFHGGEQEEYANDSAMWEKLGLPSLRDDRGESPSSSSSSSVLEPLPRGPTNQPPDLSPLVPRMLELAWQKERGQGDEQAMASSNNQLPVRAFPLLVDVRSQHSGIVFQDDDDDSPNPSAWHHILPNLPSSVSTTSLPTSTTDFPHNIDEEPPILSETQHHLRLSDDYRVFVSPGDDADHNQYHSSRMRDQLDTLEAWILRTGCSRPRMTNSFNEIASPDYEESNHSHLQQQQQQPQPSTRVPPEMESLRDELESLERYIFQQLVAQISPRKTTDLEDDVDKFQKRKLSGKKEQYPDEIVVTTVREAAADNNISSLDNDDEPPILQLDTSEGAHSVDTSLSESLIMEEVQESPTATVASPLIPFVSTPPPRQRSSDLIHKSYGEADAGIGENTSTLIPTLIVDSDGEGASGDHKSSSTTGRRNKVIIIFDESVLHDGSLSVSRDMDSSTASIAPVEKPLHRAASGLVGDSEVSRQNAAHSSDPRLVSRPTMDHFPHSDELFWTNRVRWSVTDDIKGKARFHRCRHFFGKWGRNRRSSTQHIPAQ